MKTKAKVIEYNPTIEPKRVHGYKDVRWVENASRGLRRVGFADEITRAEGRRTIDHKGWFATDDGDGDVYRGVVYQLPARHGLPHYVIGYDDPNNEDAALLSFFAPFVDKVDAAKSADRFAEIFAEEARDYDRAWQAGRRFEDLDEEVKEMRKEALAIGAEMRAAKRAVADAPTICSTLRAKIRSLYRGIQKARKERAELRDTYGRHEGWAP